MGAGRAEEEKRAAATEEGNKDRFGGGAEGETASLASLTRRSAWLFLPRGIQTYSTFLKREATSSAAFRSGSRLVAFTCHFFISWHTARLEGLKLDFGGSDVLRQQEPRDDSFILRHVVRGLSEIPFGFG